MNKKIANKVAIHQPNFFPWLGYFECIDIVDIYIFLDDVPFGSKPKRMNRNFISNHKGEKKNFTMSVSTPSLDSEIRDCKVVRDPFFFHYRDLLKENYQNAPFFKETFKVIDEIYEFKSDSVSDFNINLVTLICSKIGIKTSFRISSKDFNCRCRPTESHILKILKKAKASDFYGAKRGIEVGLYNHLNFKKEKINIYKQEYIHPNYNHRNFLPYLSIIDLLFYNFDNALEIIRTGRNWVKLN
tara:strand:+ start:352 stop:1080 length:729 start_codon:yes stop_codon:yes gene_type:complete